MSGFDIVIIVEEVCVVGFFFGFMVEQVMDCVVLFGEDFGEIIFYWDCEWWYVYLVGGFWSCIDNVFNVLVYSFCLVLDLFLVLFVFFMEEFV